MFWYFLIEKVNKPFCWDDDGFSSLLLNKESHKIKYKKFSSPILKNIYFYRSGCVWEHLISIATELHNVFFIFHNFSHSSMH